MSKSLLSLVLAWLPSVLQAASSVSFRVGRLGSSWDRTYSKSRPPHNSSSPRDGGRAAIQHQPMDVDLSTLSLDVNRPRSPLEGSHRALDGIGDFVAAADLRPLCLVGKRFRSDSRVPAAVQRALAGGG